MEISEYQNDDVISKSYAVKTDSYDEMWAGQVRPHWRKFIQSIDDLGGAEIVRLNREAIRMLRENGVTYNVHGDPEGLNRRWQLDLIPLIIDSGEWKVIESGLIQRAELFNLILSDIYGPGRLLKDGMIPLELVYSLDGFLPQCAQIRLPEPHQLIIYAADMARGPDDRMWILSDHTQMPRGSGYALENRTATARVLPDLIRDCQVIRLADFFRNLRIKLASIAPRGKDNPRIVVLTPGPKSADYFEHAYLAAYLGYTLVQGDDLTVRDGAVWLKSIDGLQPVDVILRRVDDRYCDPLELRGDSHLGVAGLLEAARRGSVAVANPLGSSVLENSGLMAFLPRIAQYFGKAELILPSAATWWCGQSKELDHVLKHLHELVIKPVYNPPDIPSVVFGVALTKKELEELKNRIQAKPHLFVGQEMVSFSTTPSLINGQLEPHHATLRSFLVAHEHGYAVMPGGLTLSAPDKDNLVVSERSGGISKDTWVLTAEPQEYISLWLEPGGVEDTVKSTFVLTSRATENLYWVGRYSERAEGTARLLRTILRRLEERDRFAGTADITCLHVLLGTLTQITETYPGFVGKGRKQLLLEPGSELVSIALDSQRSGSLATTIRSLVHAANAVRDRWSTDSWRVINGIEEYLSAGETSDHVALADVRNKLDRLITFLVAFTGLNMESMTREPGWILLDIGRRIERGLLMIRMLQATLVNRHDEPVEYLLMESILATKESLITYRYKYRSFLQLETTLELLLLDETNPRSLVYQLNHLQQHISELPKDRVDHRLNHEERLVLKVLTNLRLADLGTLSVVKDGARSYERLGRLLSRLEKLLIQTSETLSCKYFTHAQVPQQLVSIFETTTL